MSPQWFIVQEEKADEVVRILSNYMLPTVLSESAMEILRWLSLVTERALLHAMQYGCIEAYSRVGEA